MTTKQPLVSIIMPAYNSAKTIGGVVDHILGQRYANIELVVVDDGSSDKTPQILKQYHDKRLKILTQTNAGAAAARNTGLAATTGDYIMFIDSDDKFSDDFIPKMVDTIMSHNVDIAICGHGGDGVRSLLPAKAGLVDRDLPYHITSSILKNGLLYALWNKIYRADIIKQHNIQFHPDVKYGEDLIFNLEYFEFVQKIYYLREPLYEYVRRSSGLSAKTASNIDYRRQMLKVLRNYLGDNLKQPRIALKYRLIQLRWLASTKKAKLKQRKQQ